jgi:hypothetical protein
MHAAQLRRLIQFLQMRFIVQNCPDRQLVTAVTSNLRWLRVGKTAVSLLRPPG